MVGVQTVGRLVEDQDFGIVEKGLGEAGAVAVAFGQRFDRLAGDGSEETGVDGPLDGVVLVTTFEPADGGAELEEADDGHIIIKRRGFREVADLGLGGRRVVDDGNSADFGITGGGGYEARDHPHGGGFPSPVRPEKSENFAFLDREREVVHGTLGSELFGQGFDFDHGWKMRI